MTTNNWLLIYSTSPVQSFITSSRKTRDFFLSSYTLSFITFKLLNFLFKNFKGVEVVYPVLEEQGLYKLLKGDEVTLHDLLVANFPNKLVVLLKNKHEVEVREIKKGLLEEFRRVLNALHEKSFEELLSFLCEKASKFRGEEKVKIDKNFEKLCEHLDQSKVHFFNYFQPFLVVKKLKDLNEYKLEYNLTEYLLGLRKTFRRYDGKEDGYKTVEGYYPNGCTVCGERLHTVLDLTPLSETADLDESERLCGVCLTKRYSGYFYGKNLKSKGEEQLKQPDREVLKFLGEVTAELWGKRRDWIVPFTRFPSTNEVSLSREKFAFINTLIKNINNENLRAVISKLHLNKLMQNFSSAFTYALNPTYVNKLWSKISTIKDEELKKNLKYLIFLHAEFLSTEYLGKLQRDLSKEGKEKELDNLKSYTSTLKDLFRILKQETAIDFEKVFNKAPYFAIVFSDGDNIGKILGGDPNFIKGEFNKEFHYKFSARLSTYATEITKVAEEGFTKVVYAGGDDFYTFCHPSEVPSLLDRSSNLYSCLLEHLLKKPSTSAGVVIGHATVNLKFLTRKVHEAEKVAKSRFGRNAFVIKIISRSGEESSFGSKFEYPRLPAKNQPLKVLKELVALYGGFVETSEGLLRRRPSKLSSRLPYSLREIASLFPTKEEMKLPPKREGESEEQYKSRVLEKLRSQEGFVLSLLKREVRRKVQATGEEADRLTEKVFEMLSNLLREQVREHLMSPAEALNNLASLLYATRFIAQGGSLQ